MFQRRRARSLPNGDATEMNRPPNPRPAEKKDETDTAPMLEAISQAVANLERKLDELIARFSPPSAAVAGAAHHGPRDPILGQDAIVLRSDAHPNDIAAFRDLFARIAAPTQHTRTQYLAVPMDTPPAAVTQAHQLLQQRIPPEPEYLQKGHVRKG